MKIGVDSFNIASNRNYHFRFFLWILLKSIENRKECFLLKEERVLNPIITWNGYIVDGHTRYQILRKYPFISFEVIEKEFSSRYEALVWICKNQLGRRNLTPNRKSS